MASKANLQGLWSNQEEPEIHALPLKRKPEPTDIGEKVLDPVMDSMPAENAMMLMTGGYKVEWWKHPDTHWYIIGGQHTVTACRELAEQFPADSEARKELLEFEVIPVFTRDT